jgi:hypothetical protein
MCGDRVWQWRRSSEICGADCNACCNERPDVGANAETTAGEGKNVFLEQIEKNCVLRSIQKGGIKNGYFKVNSG